MSASSHAHHPLHLYRLTVAPAPQPRIEPPLARNDSQPVPLIHLPRAIVARFDMQRETGFLLLCVEERRGKKRAGHGAEEVRGETVTTERGGDGKREDVDCWCLRGGGERGSRVDQLPGDCAEKSRGVGRVVGNEGERGRVREEDGVEGRGVRDGERGVLSREYRVSRVFSSETSESEAHLQLPHPLNIRALHRPDDEFSRQPLLRLVIPVLLVPERDEFELPLL